MLKEKKLPHMHSDKKLIDLVFLCAIGFISILWFKQDYINGGDFSFPMSPIANVLSNYWNVWTDKWGLGLFNSRAIPQLPLIALITLGNKIGIATAIAERILFYLLFTLPGLSIYFLVNVLPPMENKRIMAFFAALFYMFNPYSFIFNWHVLDGMVFVYAVLPILLVLYLQWLNTKKITYAVLFMIVSFIGGYTFSNPLIIPILWFLLLTFSLFFISSEKNIAVLLKFYFKALIVWSLLNGWWLVPLIGGMKDEYSGLSATIGSPWATLETFSMKTSFLNLFRMSNIYWAFGDSIFGDPYYNYASIYSSPLFLAISFILPIVVFSPMLKPMFKEKLPIFILLLYALTLFYLFIAKGSHAPLGKDFYQFLFKLPFMPAFRAPIHKIGVLLSINYAILFGYGITFIYRQISKKNNFIANAAIVIISVGVFVIYAFPFWTGEIIHDGGKVYSSYHVKVPSYYQKASEWLDSDKDYFRFYSLPQSPTFNGAYDWGNGYIGTNPSFNFFSKPGVYSTVNETAQLPYSLLRDSSTDEIYKILRLQGVKYLILHKDINENMWDIFSAKYKSVDYLEKRLRTQKNIQCVKEIGKLKFYKISEDQYLPIIYAASSPVFIFSDRNSLVSLLHTTYLERYPAVFFVNEHNNQDKLAQMVGEERWLSERKNILVDCSFSNVVPAAMTFGQVDVNKKMKDFRKFIKGANGYIFYFAENDMVEKNADKNINSRQFFIHDQGYYNLKVLLEHKKPMRRSAKKAFLRIDNKIFTLNSEMRKGTTEWVTFKKIFLKGGRHDIDNVMDDTCKIYLLEVEGVSDKPTNKVTVPELKFKKISPTKYVVNMSRSNDPFVLVFSENFHSGWKAYVRPESDSNERFTVLKGLFGEKSDNIELKNHFVVNSYANGWLVPNEKMISFDLAKKEYQIILEFEPQALFEIGVFVSLAAAIGIIGYLGYRTIRGRKAYV